VLWRNYGLRYVNTQIACEGRLRVCAKKAFRTPTIPVSVKSGSRKQVIGIIEVLFSFSPTRSNLFSLSAARTPRSGVPAESNDPYALFGGRGASGISAPLLAGGVKRTGVEAMTHDIKTCF
jgi:hypothetical protein